MKSQYRLLIFVLAFLIMSCNQKNEVLTSTQYSEHLIPLAVGNSWTYSRSDYDTLGKVTTTYTYPTRIEYDTIVGGVHWFSLLDVDVSVWYRDSVAGVVMYPSNKLLYKYPASKQDSFPAAIGTYTMKVISIDTTINVTAGTFTCYAYLEANPPDSYFIYYYYVSPGIGVVKSEAYRRTQSRSYLPWMMSELKSYIVH